jgi:hypothetical protein
MGFKRVDSVSRDIDAMVRGDLSPAAQGKAIAKYVKEGIDEADQANRRVLGRVPPRTVTVDGQLGAAVETVNPNGGSIIVEWDLVGDVLVWIGQTLHDRSPVSSGAYRNGHTLLADNDEVDPGATIPPAEQYVFINTVPYARRIEIGKTKSGRDFVMQVPNRIYERTARDAKARFGNVAKIQFNYLELEGAYVTNGKMQSQTPRYATGQVRKVTQRHWVGTSATGEPAHWVTYGAGEAKTRIRRHKSGEAVKSPVIIVALGTS